jgi:hypothetical protein
MADSDRMTDVPDTDRDAAAAARSAEQAIIDSRRAKAKKVRDSGENPFANDVSPRLEGAQTEDIVALRARVA